MQAGIPQFCEAGSQETVADHVVGAGKVVGDQHGLLCRLAVRNLLLGWWARLLLPSVLDLLRQPGDDVLVSALLSEADLFLRCEVRQPGGDDPLGQFRDVRR